MSQQFSQHDMAARLHAVDRDTAKQAVAWFVQQRNPAPLVERLKSGGDEVRLEAVRGLAVIGDPAAVPALADLLEAEVEPYNESEGATIQKLLKEAALRAASELSGESFEVRNLDDERELKAVVQRIRAKHGRV